MHILTALTFLRLQDSIVVEVAEILVASKVSLLLHVFEENEDFEIHDVGHFEDGFHQHLEDGRLKV